jgi:methyl-accepting chemotaxis protein
MTLRKKLLGIITFFIFVALAIGAGGGYGLYNTGKSLNHLVDNNMVLANKTNNLHITLNGTRIYEKEFFQFAELKVIEKRDNYYKKYMKKIGGMKAALLELKSGNSESDAIIGEIEGAVAMAETAMKNLAVLLVGGKSFLDVQDAYVPYRTAVRLLKANIIKLKEYVALENERVVGELKELQNKFFMVFSAAAAVLVFIGLLAGFIFHRQVSSALRTLMDGIKQISAGEMAVLPVESNDEFGEISTAFNSTMDKLKGYIQTDAERQKSQENLMNFLDVLSTASEGDFTKRAPVTADIFGSVADAFNMMLDELAALVTDVRSTAVGIGEDSSTTLNLLKNMADGSEKQMVQLKGATESVDETSQATLTISEKTQDASELSAKAEEASNKGEQLVSKSIEGMQVIRAAVQVINKKMKMFSERIIEIGTISGMISDIATRTNLLSMNASIEASRAGESGKGFVVIAEEIRNLADRSANATTDITNIIRTIQTEAGEITSSLEDETEIVERQSSLATEIKSSFSEIKSAIDGSKGIVLEIKPLSDTQRQITSNVVLSMENVNRISLDLLKLVQDSESISGRLSSSSRNLLASVEKFKLLEAGEAGQTRKVEAVESAIEAEKVVETETFSEANGVGA